MHNTVIQLFAKPPTPGKVKTRLIADIGEDSATAIYLHCLQRNINLIHNSPFDYQIWLTEPSQHTLFKDEPIKIQQGKILGEKMYSALHEALSRQKYKKVILIGTDCLDFTSHYFKKVNKKLDQAELLFVPAWDGGYVLIAAKNTINLNIFREIEWGSDKVLKQSLDRAMQSGINTKILNSLRDIDRVDDLSHYVELNQYL